MFAYLTGAFFGFLLGFIAAALLGALHRGDHSQEICRAFHDGLAAGRDPQGNTLTGNTLPWSKPLTQAMIDAGWEGE